MGTAVFLALGRFLVADSMAATVRKAFRNRPHAVDHAFHYSHRQVSLGRKIVHGSAELEFFNFVSE